CCVILYSVAGCPVGLDVVHTEETRVGVSALLSDIHAHGGRVALVHRWAANASANKPRGDCRTDRACCRCEQRATRNDAVIHQLFLLRFSARGSSGFAMRRRLPPVGANHRLNTTMMATVLARICATAPTSAT